MARRVPCQCSFSVDRKSERSARNDMQLTAHKHTRVEGYSRLRCLQAHVATSHMGMHRHSERRHVAACNHTHLGCDML